MQPTIYPLLWYELRYHHRKHFLWSELIGHLVDVSNQRFDDEAKGGFDEMQPHTSPPNNTSELRDGCLCIGKLRADMGSREDLST